MFEDGLIEKCFDYCSQQLALCSGSDRVMVFDGWENIVAVTMDHWHQVV